jgi:adenine/guanine phosphoribosyltransferase-like PRPP-binding protein
MISNHLNAVMNPALRESLLGIALQRLQAAPAFDAIAGTGLSGVLFGVRLADRLDKPFVPVRKPEEKDASHADTLVEGYVMGKRVLMVDDFVAGGNTMRRMARALTAEGAILVGAYVYRGTADRGRDIPSLTAAPGFWYQGSHTPPLYYSEWAHQLLGSASTWGDI